MRSASYVVIIVGVLALSSVNLASGNPGRANSSKLFDYENYKRTFGKSYSSELENSARKCYFYARALDAFVSGVSYKYRNADYYKALNEMSDWARKERASVKNKRAYGTEARSGEGLESHTSGPLTLMPAEGENPVETLRKYLTDHLDDDPIYKDLLDQLDQPPSSTATGTVRRKRNVGPSQEPRNFSFNKLIYSDDGSTPAERRRSARIQSNNPQYRGIELMTRGLSDQLEEVNLLTLEPTLVEPGSLKKHLELALSWLGGGSRLGSKIDGGAPDTGSGKLKDEIFFDHRQSGCLSEVRKQGGCGCCYAFAATAIAEWRYCKKNGRLVAFSEQYMIDCGRGRVAGLFGCLGGAGQSALEFIHNFGLELRSNYPYLKDNGVCPYGDDTDLSSTGYIRMNMDAFIEVPLALWPDFIERAPMYVMVDATDDAFLDYGGGVDDGSKCIRQSDDDELDVDYHAMALIGHGREDGEEYWLMRNSFGKDWGDQGHYKLSKDAAPRCIASQVAWVFGTEKVRPRKNRHNTEPVMMKPLETPSED